MKTKQELFKLVETRLHNYKLLDARIENLKLDIESYEYDITGCKGIAYTDDKTISNSFNSTVENEVVSREKIINEMKDKLRKKQIEKRRIVNALQCLDEREKEFFELFFNSKDKKSMVYIGMHMHMERKTCYLTKKSIIYKMMNILYMK